MVGRMNGHQPRIVSVARRGDDEPLFPRLDAVRPTISQREMLRRANAARDEQEARANAARDEQAERIIAAVEREMRLQVGTRPPGAPMATRIHAGRSALVTAASVALVGACVALALWLGSL